MLITQQLRSRAGAPRILSSKVPDGKPLKTTNPDGTQDKLSIDWNRDGVVDANEKRRGTEFSKMLETWKWNQEQLKKPFDERVRDQLRSMKEDEERRRPGKR